LHHTTQGFEPERQWIAFQVVFPSALAAFAIVGLDAPMYMNQFIPYDQRTDHQDEGHKVKEVAHYQAEVVEPGDGIFLEERCISAQVRNYLPPEVAAKHWEITGKTQRVFFVPPA
jgi:hypothetical protein